jgi:ABC-type polysaccharide/polyol phosphate export permease
MHHNSDLPITIFALTGYSTVLLWRNMITRCVGSVAPNSSLMYHRNVRVMDIYISRIALEGIGATMSFVFLSLFFAGIGTAKAPEDILTIVIGWILTSWFGLAAGVFLGALSEISEVFEKLWHPVAYILFPISGAAFLADALPESLRNAVLWLPMVNGTEMIRDGYFGSKFTAYYDAIYVVEFNLVLTILAFALERKVSREYVLE